MDGISPSLTALQASGQSVALSANNIANMTTPGYRAKSLAQAGGPVLESQAPMVPGGSNVEPANEALNLDTQNLGYQANLKVLKTQDKMLGSALDMKA